MYLMHGWGGNIENSVAAWPTTEQAGMVGDFKKKNGKNSKKQIENKSENKSEKKMFMMVCKKCSCRGDMAPDVAHCLREKHEHVQVLCTHEQCTTLYVKNLPPHITQYNVFNWLKEAGCDATTNLIYIPRHWDKDEAKGFGFINVRHHDQIANVVKMLYEKNLQLRPEDKLSWNWADRQGLAALVIHLRDSPVVLMQNASPIILESGKAVPLGEGHPFFWKHEEVEGTETEE